MQINYGKIYIDESSKKGDKQNQAGAYIGLSSQRVYTLIPARFDYENNNGVCKQLCLFNTELFFSQVSFIDYSMSFARVLKSLSENNPSSIVDILHTYNAGNVLNNYNTHSKFIKGEDISTEIMRFAINIPVNYKASVIFTIGGHSISLVMNNHKDHINLAYYDPYFSQLYVQKVTKAEINNVLLGYGSFTSPTSILNQNNILIGRAALRDDSATDPKVSFSLITFINNTKTDKKSYDIEIAKGVATGELLEYLALVPPMLYNIKYAVNTVAFNAFIKQSASELGKKYESARECVSLTTRCANSYLLDIIATPYRDINDYFIQKLVQNRFSSINIDEARSNKGLHNSKLKSQICMKESDIWKELTVAERNFLKLIFQEKDQLSELILRCISSTSLLEKKGWSKKICEKFEDADSEYFSNLNNDYYNSRDALKISVNQEQCYSERTIIEVLGENYEAEL